MGVALPAFGQRIPNQGGILILFDIDGTVLPGTSCERLFVRYLIHNGILSPSNFVNFIIRGILLLYKNPVYSLKANKGYLRGFSTERISAIGLEFFNTEVASRISKVAIERINEHKRRSERVIIFSGMPDFLLANFAEFLGVHEYYGSVMETKGGKFTGRTLGPFPLGHGKVKLIRQLISETHFNWSDLTFYGDHWLDRFLLSRVGKPVAVNPHQRLRRMARRRGWMIEKF
jgi:putative phosphoserine phosphatase / 1-acylglycerol-3-phosphate O-acyltransferase